MSRGDCPGPDCFPVSQQSRHGAQHTQHHRGQVRRIAGSRFQRRIQRSLRQVATASGQTAQGQDSCPPPYPQSGLRRRFHFLRHRRKSIAGNKRHVLLDNPTTGSLTPSVEPIKSSKLGLLGKSYELTRSSQRVASLSAG